LTKKKYHGPLTREGNEEEENHRLVHLGKIMDYFNFMSFENRH
jgi:hypothetical protein